MSNNDKSKSKVGSVILNIVLSLACAIVAFLVIYSTKGV